MEQLQEGDYVTILKEPIKNEKGYIKYIGELDGRQGVYFGIQLDNKVGNHNGTVGGKEYFTCPDGYGLLITGNHLKKAIAARDPAKKSTKVNEQPKTQKQLKTSQSSAAVVQKNTTTQGKNSKTMKRDESKKETIIKKEDNIEDQQQQQLPIIEAENEVQPILQKNQSEPEPQFSDPVQELESYKQQLQALKIVVNDYKLENKSLKKKIDSQDNELNSLIEDLDNLEKYIMENEQLKQDKEILNIKTLEQQKLIEDLEKKIEELKSDKELADLELQEAILLCGSNLSTDTLGSGELSQKNGKLQLALNQVNEEYNNYKLQKQNEIQQYLQRLEVIPQLNEKVLKVTKLENQVKKLTEENQELCQRIDEGSALQDMIEKMSETLLKKDDQMEELRNQFKETNELKKVDQELISTLEDVVNSQEKTINDFQFQIDQLNSQIINKQNEFIEKDSIIARLKQKIVQQNKMIDSQRLEEDNQNQEQPNKKAYLDEVNHKNQELVQNQRETYKKCLKLSLTNIEIRNQIALKGIIIYKSFPQDYCTKLRFNLLEPVILVRKISEKSILISDEFLLQLENQSDKFIKEELTDLGFWMLNAQKSFNQLSDLCNQYSMSLQNETEKENLERLARNGILVNQFKITDALVDMILSYIQNDKVSTQISLSELSFAIQRITDDLSNLQEQEGAIIESLLNQVIHKYTYSIFNYKVIINQSNNNSNIVIDQLIDTLIQRAKELLKQLRYGRQCWGGFFNRKNEKFTELIQQLKELLTQNLNNLQLDQYQAYISCQGENVSQIYRDRCVTIVHLLNQVTSNFDEQNINEEFVSNKQTQHSYQQNCLWAQWQKELRSQLQDISYTIESEKRLREDLQKLQGEKNQIYSDSVALRKAKEALESRVVDLQIKADKVQVLENEKQRNLEKIRGFNEASELTRKEIDNLENKLKESEDIKKQLEEQIHSYQQQQPKQSLLDQLQNRNYKKSGTLLIQSSQNLDNDHQLMSQELIINKGIESVLLKENACLKLHKMRENIIEISKNQIKPQVDKELNRIRQLKMKQLKSMALGESFDARTQATQFYIKPSGLNVTNKGLFNTLQSIIAV